MAGETPRLPRADYPEDDVRAWMHDNERELLAALDCRDIAVTLKVAVELHEHQEIRRQGKRPKRNRHAALTPREKEASRLLTRRGDAHFLARLFLFEYAQMRRQTILLERAARRVLAAHDDDRDTDFEAAHDALKALLPEVAGG